MFYEENSEKQQENVELVKKNQPFSHKNKKAGDAHKISRGNEYVIQEKHKTIGFFVKQMRETYGLTIASVISRCNIPLSAYQMLEAGDMRVKFPYVERILQLYGYSLLPVLDLNNSEIMENIKELPNRADYMLAVKLSKEMSKSPILRKCSKTEITLQRYLLRFAKKNEMRLLESNDEKVRAKIAKKYRNKLKQLRQMNRFILSFMPNAVDRRECGLVMRKYNLVRKRRNLLAKRVKIKKK
jgi:hypothetical protein